MTPEEKRIVRVASRYLKICRDFGYWERCGRDWGTDADIDHSDLLQRLLDGKEPYPVPPPLSSSYPWTTLMDNGYARCYEVHGPYEWETGIWHMVINQSDWRIVDGRENEEYVVSYRDDAPMYYLWKDGIDTRGPRPEHIWYLARLSEFDKLQEHLYIGKIKNDRRIKNHQEDNETLRKVKDKIDGFNV